MRLIVVSLLLSCFCTPAIAQQVVQPDDILGQYWTTDQTGKIEIIKEDDVFYGKIIWRKETRKDTKNRDVNLRSRDVIGLTFLEGFRFKNGAWVGGSVYSIDNGKTYAGKLWLEENGSVLKMRGHLKVSRLLGRTATLTRIQ